MKEERINISHVGDDLAKAYEQGVEDGKPKWIPVTERLPEKEEVVLCHCRANIIETLAYYDESWQGYSGRYMKGFVTHWMPLPEPPKEVSDALQTKMQKM